MSSEKKIILEMLKNDKITVDEAELLLSKLQSDSSVEISAPSVNRKFLRVLVMEGEKTSVNINIPIALAEVGLKLIPEEKLSLQGNAINLQDIIALIQEGTEGELMHIDTVDKGKRVKVKISID